MSTIISNCGTYRYRLERIFGPQPETCMFIMLNPSTADHVINDLTVKRCLRFAAAFGCGRLLVGNLFAYRTTWPEELKLAVKPEGPNNLRHLKRMCMESNIVIAAWGENGKFLGQDQKILAKLWEWGVPLHVLKLSKGGHPRHPSRLSAALVPQLGK